ncbi:hypothetical protein L484_009550 [Morus notabilis]|uniref:Fungal lipase-type domain-containing protein n=1 Tax=Morus notabilis TaxID=981085 RepID=W9SA05_9ROSA|nr:uncharacterized protein LOC21392875 [Morus notabilis]EXC32850.1 hypothetical protein L484_009550 [Morus notabilis]
MAYQKGLKLRNYLLIKPKEASFLQFIRLLFSPNSNRISFIEFSEEEGQKLRESLLFRLIITASAFVQKLLLKIRVPMAKVGDLLESLLNIITANGGLIALLRNLTTGKVVLPTPIQSASVIGNLDTRVDLDKNITTDDDKYLGALTMMAAKLAYESAAYVTNVVQFHWKMQFLGFYNYWNDYLGTFSTPVFLFQDAKFNAKLVVVAFRGTDPFSADGWSTDIDLSYYEIENVGKVHRGFAKALGIIQNDNTMPSQLLEQNKDGIDLKPYAYYEIVKLLKGILLLNPKAKFIVTGHSLGGALSVMFAAALAMHGEADLLGKLQGVYTYGQPRVGDEQFGTYMEQKLSKYNLSYNRYVYSFDLVPRIPFDDNSFLYKHFGKCLFFNSLYKGKVLEDAPDKNYFSLIWYFPKLLNALWELIRSFINPHKYGPDYKEGWFQILYRLFGILVPGLSAHGPQDYVNLTRLGSVPALNGPDDDYEYDEPIKVLIQP